MLIRADTGALVDARDLPPALTWRCAHETCGLLIDELEQRWAAEGRPDLALCAAELRMQLPFGDQSMEIAAQRLARVRAWFN